MKLLLASYLFFFILKFINSAFSAYLPLCVSLRLIARKKDTIALFSNNFFTLDKLKIL